MRYVKTFDWKAIRTFGEEGWGAWEVLSVDIDEQVKRWVDQTGVKVVSAVTTTNTFYNNSGGGRPVGVEQKVCTVVWESDDNPQVENRKEQVEDQSPGNLLNAFK